MDIAMAINSTESYNQNAPPGYHAKILSIQYSDPINPVPALRHYRLIYESSSESLPDGPPDSVKIFERVNGAVIKGDGTIELPLITNTGRNFTYRQESINSTFTVPYSTTDNNYAVKATGKYSIVGTGTQFYVSEQDVMTGRTIN
jgi:dolichyl-diphosphooligosaccharide--protein glycosyltransferase